MNSKENKSLIRNWLNEYDFNVALTLKFNRKLCPIKANILFETFSGKQDRKLYGRYFYRKPLGIGRAFAIGYVENGSNRDNTHIHLTVAVPNGKEQEYIDNSISSLLSVWKSGTVKVEHIYSKAGWVKYISKYIKDDSEMIISKGKTEIYSEVS